LYLGINKSDNGKNRISKMKTSSISGLSNSRQWKIK